ncbi:MAG: DNA repair protein RecN [Candidatus Aminicenantes bacterium]|nr:DNA repair protein RecN [Candidatus Aminicenantes bacterium]
MIRHLRIRNLATIEDIALEFEPGLAVLTGETGAGKSIIIDGLRLICGEKGGPDLVRSGAKEAVVEASAATAEGTEVAIQRSVGLEGPGKTYLDGVLVPLKKLKDAASELIDLYGQNDHVFLLHTENHLDYLDEFAGTRPLREETEKTAQNLRRLNRRREEWMSRAKERAGRLDVLEYQIREIEKAGLRPGEDEELRTERHILKNAEKIRTLVDEAYEIAYEGDRSISTLLARLGAVLTDLAAIDPRFREAADLPPSLNIAVGELAGNLARHRGAEFAPAERLEDIEERLSLIEGFKRKYGSEIEEIRSYLDRLKAEREDLVLIQGRLAETEREIGRSVEAYLVLADRLSAERRTAASALGALIEKEISLLGMKKARFVVDCRTRRTSPFEASAARDTGLDDVEFLIGPNPGEPVKPLRKIASGGELSRVMLALKAAGKDRASGRTMVFDEIDAGIGGQTAEAVAQRLRSLARRHQVICITHLPQIASFAAHHFRIDKRVERDRTYTFVKKLGLEDRVAEIARLMSGSRISEAGLESARQLIRRNAGL